MNIKSTWPNPSQDNELMCEREVGNAHDTHAVAIKDCLQLWDTFLETKISKVSSIFIRSGGTIQCRVNGHRRYSADLHSTSRVRNSPYFDLHYR